MTEYNQDPNSQNTVSMKSKILHFPITKIIIGVIICFLVPAIFKAIVKPLLGLLNLGGGITDSIQGIFTIAVMLITYYVLFKYYEKRKITELSRKYLLKDMLVGFFIAAFIISLVILILYFLGYFRILAINNIIVILVPLIFLAVMSVFEEIIFRGVIYRITEESWGTNWALLISALLFGIIHLVNKDANIIYIISATFGGLLIGILFSYTGRLWAPIFFHLGWNFAQYFYGTNRFMDTFSFFLESKLEGPQALTGGQTGIENSILTLIFILVVFGVIYYVTLKKGNVKKAGWKTGK